MGRVQTNPRVGPDHPATDSSRARATTSEGGRADPTRLTVAAARDRVCAGVVVAAHAGERARGAVRGHAAIAHGAGCGRRGGDADERARVGRGGRRVRTGRGHRNRRPDRPHHHDRHDRPHLPPAARPTRGRALLDAQDKARVHLARMPLLWRSRGGAGGADGRRENVDGSRGQREVGEVDTQGQAR